MNDEIVAFDPGQTTDEDFADWFAGEAEWQEGSDDPIILDTDGLEAFYADLTRVFPPRQGPGSPSAAQLNADPTLLERLTDYSMSHYLILVTFRDDQVEEGSRLMGELGQKHDVAIASLGEPTVIVRPVEPAV
jgi:hypothetical protein